jgi:hypothetical protein
MKLFDRPSGEIRLDQSALDWIRQHEPGQLGVLEFTTLPRARFLLWCGRIMLANGLFVTVVVFLMAWRRPDMLAPALFALGGFGAGIALGISQQLSTAAGLARLLALLKGEGIRSDTGAGATPASAHPPA